MPKKLNSVSLNSNCLKLIENYCKNEDISEAAFSRKFEKNNRWVADLRRGRSMNLPSHDAAVQMCLLLQTAPEIILKDVGDTEEETTKCQADIARVRDLLDQQRAQSAKKATIENDEREFSPSYEDWLKQADYWNEDQLAHAMRKLLDLQDKKRENGR